MTAPTYARKDGIIETELPGELFLLDPTDQKMYRLNATGAWVWRELPGEPLPRLRTRFGAEFGLSDDRAAADLGAVLADLERDGLIRRTPPENA